MEKFLGSVKSILMLSTLSLFHAGDSQAMQATPTLPSPPNKVTLPTKACPPCQKPVFLGKPFTRPATTVSGWQQTLDSWRANKFDYDLKVKKDLRFVFNTDIGFDPDDYLGLVSLLKYVKETYPQDYKNRVFVSTTFWHPEQKAAIARKIMEAYGFNPDYVQPGIGIYAGEENTFRDRYLWSALFGKPQSNCPPRTMDEVIAEGKKIEAKEISDEQAKEIKGLYKGCIYQYQTDALEKTYPNVTYPKFKNRAARDLLGFLQGSANNSVVVVSNAAMDDIANIIDTQPDLFKKKVNRVVTMGGYFNTPGKERTGYNTGISLKASAKVFNSGVPVLLVSSTFAATYDLSRPETESFFLPTLKQIFEQPGCTINPAPCMAAKMISRASYNWEFHRVLSGTSGGVLAADVINTNTAIAADKIKAAKPVTFVIHPEKIQDPKTFDIITTTNMPEQGIYTLNENPDPKTSTIFSLSQIEIARLDMWNKVFNDLKAGF